MSVRCLYVGILHVLHTETLRIRMTLEEFMPDDTLIAAWVLVVRLWLLIFLY